jgi:hypothetical protein
MSSRGSRVFLVGTGAALLMVAGAALLTTRAHEGPSGASVSTSRLADASLGGSVAYPRELVKLGEDSARTMYADQLVKIRERDDSPVLTGRRSDYALAFTAWEAKVRGLPFDAGDELVPLVDENGEVVAYDTRGVNRLITVAEATGPGFDICALRDAQFEADVARVADDERLPPEVRAQRPTPNC